MSLTRTSEPASEPITTAEAKTAMRVDFSDDDTYIDTLIKPAREAAETFLNRSIVTQTWVWRLDAFPDGDKGGVFVVPYPPLASVTSIAYLDTDGDSQTLSTDVYEVDPYMEPGRIALKYNQSWPSIRASVINPVTVTFVAGAALASGEFRVKQAIKMLVAHWYNVRETQVFGTKKIPFAVKHGFEDLLYTHRMVDFDE